MGKKSKFQNFSSWFLTLDKKQAEPTAQKEVPKETPIIDIRTENNSVNTAEENETRVMKVNDSSAPSVQNEGGGKIEDGPKQEQKSEELQAEIQQDYYYGNEPQKDGAIPKSTKLIEYKQASEQDSERNEGIEKLVGHVQIDCGSSNNNRQTFGNKESNGKQSSVQFDASVDEDLKKKLRNSQPAAPYGRYKNQQLIKEKPKKLAPSPYKGNSPSPYKGKGGLIQPVRPQYVPLKRDVNPGPGAYQTDRADKIVKAKAPASTIPTGMKKSNTVKEITPAPGTYDSHLKPFGAEASQISIHSREPRPDERAEWLQSGQKENTPGPGFYKGNDVDFGKSSRNTLISKRGGTTTPQRRSPSVLSTRREQMAIKMAQGQPRYMSPTKTSLNKISGFSYGQTSEVTEELKRIHQSNLSVHEQLLQLERLERIHQKRVQFLQKQAKMIEMQNQSIDEDPSYQEYIGSQRFMGSKMISPPKQRLRNNFMQNTKSSINKSLLNGSISSIPERVAMNKTIDYKDTKKSAQNYSIYTSGRPAKYATLKPKLYDRQTPNVSKLGKYQSPYSQPKKKKKAKKVPELVTHDSNIQIAADLFRSLS